MTRTDYKKYERKVKSSELTSRKITAKLAMVFQKEIEADFSCLQFSVGGTAYSLD